MIRNLVRRRLEELHEEVAQLNGVLVGLDGRRQRTAPTPDTAPERPTRKSRPMTAAQRKAISRRMKAMWAEKRKRA